MLNIKYYCDSQTMFQILYFFGLFFVSVRLTYHHGDLRQRLILTAERLITEHGVSALSMRLLSCEIGVSHTAAYRHFRDKQALLCALAENGFADLARKFEALASPCQNQPLMLILAMGNAYIDFALENPARYRIMFGHLLIRFKDEPQLNKAVRKAFAPLLLAISNGQQIGEVRRGRPLELASMCWAVVHGFSQSIMDSQSLPVLMDAFGGMNH